MVESVSHTAALVKSDVFESVIRALDQKNRLASRLLGDKVAGTTAGNFFEDLEQGHLLLDLD